MTAETPVVRLDSPAAIVAAVPEMFGFTPEHSIVVVLSHSNSFGPALRLDSAGISQLAPTLRRCRTQHPQYDQAIVVTYEPVLHDAERWAAASCAVARDAGYEVLDALATADGRWRSVLCANPVCCPPGGNELPAEEPTATALRAERVASGLVTVATRADLIALAEPAGEQVDPGEITEAHNRRLAEVASHGMSAWQTGILDVLTSHVQAVAAGAEPDGPSADTPALLDALSVPEVRDTVCGWVSKTALRPAIVEVMLRLARASQHHVVDPLCVAAWHAYADGNGALANACLDRANRVHPNHNLTQMLQEFIHLGGHPSALARIATDFRTN